MILYYLDKTKTHFGVGVGGLVAVLKVVCYGLEDEGEHANTLASTVQSTVSLGTSRKALTALRASMRILMGRWRRHQPPPGRRRQIAYIGGGAGGGGAGGGGGGVLGVRLPVVVHGWPRIQYPVVLHRCPRQPWTSRTSRAPGIVVDSPGVLYNGLPSPVRHSYPLWDGNSLGCVVGFCLTILV